MNLAYKDGRILLGDIASPETVVLENVGGLTEQAVSEIVRNATVGEYVLNRLEGAGSMTLWQTAAMLSDLLQFAAKERGEHWVRCKGAVGIQELCK